MRAKEFIIELGKSEQYKKPVGAMEMVAFYRKATPEQISKLKSLIGAGKTNSAWKLLQSVTDTKL